MNDVNGSVHHSEGIEPKNSEPAPINNTMDLIMHEATFFTTMKPMMMSASNAR